MGAATHMVGTTTNAASKLPWHAAHNSHTGLLASTGVNTSKKMDYICASNVASIQALHIWPMQTHTTMKLPLLSVHGICTLRKPQNGRNALSGQQPHSIARHVIWPLLIRTGGNHATPTRNMILTPLYCLNCMPQIQLQIAGRAQDTTGIHVSTNSWQGACVALQQKPTML